MAVTYGKRRENQTEKLAETVRWRNTKTA